MKLKNIKNVEDFKAIVAQCKGDVTIHSLEGDVYNLKSAMSQYIAIGRLLDEHGDELELFASNSEDEARLVKFLCDLDKD